MLALFASLVCLLAVFVLLLLPMVSVLYVCFGIVGCIDGGCVVGIVGVAVVVYGYSVVAVCAAVCYVGVAVHGVDVVICSVDVGVVVVVGYGIDDMFGGDCVLWCCWFLMGWSQMCYCRCW